MLYNWLFFWCFSTHLFPLTSTDPRDLAHPSLSCLHRTYFFLYLSYATRHPNIRYAHHFLTTKWWILLIGAFDQDIRSVYSISIFDQDIRSWTKVYLEPSILTLGRARIIRKWRWISEKIRKIRLVLKILGTFWTFGSIEKHVRSDGCF